MSSETQNDPAEYPAVLGGPPVARPPSGTFVRWDSSREGIVPTIVPRAQPGDAVFTPAPEYVGIDRGGLKALFAPGVDREREGVPEIFEAPDIPTGLSLVFEAMLDKRYSIERWRRPARPTAPTPVWSPGTTFGELARAEVTPAFADAEIETGTTTAAALEALVDQDAAFVVASSLYGHAPDVTAIRRLCDDLKLGFVLDATRGPTFGWKAPKPLSVPDVMVLADRRDLLTPAGEALLVVWDATLVELLERYRWPSDLAVRVPVTTRHEAGRIAQLHELDRCLAERELPWQMLPAGHSLDGTLEKVVLVFEPAKAAPARREVWKRIGHTASMHMLAKELTTPVTTGYPLPWARRGESRQGMARALQDWSHPNAAYLSTHAQLLDPALFLREGAAAQVLNAMEKLDRCADFPVVGTFAERLRSA